MAKAGGLITTETLAVGRPLILVEPIPGQEEANSRWLTGAGAAIRADAPEAVGEAVTRLMGQRALAAARAQRLGRPDAAHNVLSTVLRALGQHSRAVDRHAA
jgi:processive 1,2-diacylglycerol beta-glucosyltransferase